MIEIPKTRLGVFAVEDPTLGTAVVQGNQMSVAIVGETLGAVTNIVDEPVVRQQSTLSDDLIHTDVSKISRIADIIGGVASYIQDTDYRLNSDSVEWLGTTLAPPSNVIGVAQSVVPVAPRTGLVAATYDYVITAIRTSSILTTPATVGETLPSAQVAVVVNPGGSPSTNAALLTWVPVVNAEGYRIYRKLSTDPNYDDALIAEIPGGASNFFLDDGYTAAFYADVTAATTANIADLTSASVSQDGVTLVQGNRILLKNQVNTKENGIYVVGLVGGGDAPLTRATDMDSTAEVILGKAIAVTSGTANGGKVFAVSTVPATLDTNPLLVTLVSSSEGSGTPPGANTTVNRPADGATYYATYVAVIMDYNDPQTYYNMTDLIQAHGLGSDLVVAGSLIIGGPGVGQGASFVTTVATPDSQRASFQAAVAALFTQIKNVDIIVVLSGDPNVQLDTTNAVLAASDPITGKVCKAYFGNPKSTAIGDENTAGTMIWAARRLALLDNEGNPQGQRVVYCAESSIFVDVQQSGGSVITTELDGWFLAAAVAGKVAGSGDPAMPITFKQLQGIDSLGQSFTPNERDVLDSNGLLTCFDNNGVVNVYHGRTIDLLTVEHGEINIVNAKDKMYQDLIAAFIPFVGSKISDAFLSSIENMTAKILGVEKKAELIADYDPSTIVASQQTGPGADPRRIDVTFKATPFYPANQIVFQFGFSL